MSEKRERWYLPIEEPPEGWRLYTTHIDGAEVYDSGFRRLERKLRVLGPPVPAPPDLSPEARAVLEAVAEVGENLNSIDDPGGIPLLKLKAASQAYTRTLTPPDPLAEARDALRLLDTPGANQGALARLHAALAKLGAKP